jgi:hypothetical protein
MVQRRSHMHRDRRLNSPRAMTFVILHNLFANDRVRQSTFRNPLRIGTISHIFLPFLPDYHRAHHTKVGRAIQFALSDYDA